MATEIMIFETKDNEIKLTVPVENETVWLTQAQMTELFQVDRTVITRHVNNVFKENELLRKRNVQKMHIPDCRQSGARTVVLAPFFSVCSNRSPKMIKKSILSSLSYRFFEASLLVFLDSCRQR